MMMLSLELKIQIENMKKMDTEQQQNVISVLKSVMSFLLLVQEESNILIQ